MIEKKVKNTVEVPKKPFCMNSAKKQANAINKVFGIGEKFNPNIVNSALPKHADGWIIFPRWCLLAPTYASAVELVFYELHSMLNHGVVHGLRVFKDFSGVLLEDYIRFVETKNKAENIQRIEIFQVGYGMLAVPAFTGLCSEHKQPKENCFDLGLFEYVMFLLTHIDNIFNVDENVKVSCLGDVLKGTETMSLFFEISKSCIESNFADSFGDKAFAKGFIV